MQYRQLRLGVNDSSYKLLPIDEIYQNIKPGNSFQDYFTSIYKYNESQYQTFQKTKSIKGVDNVTTDWLVFDFDSKDAQGKPDPENSIADAREMAKRLVESGIESENLRIAFSGGKGFHIEVRHTDELTPDEHKAIASQMANGLASFDPKVYDHARPFRMIGSVNKKTGLYKIPLTFDELNNLSVSEIKDKARVWGKIDRSKFNWQVINLPSAITDLKKFKKDHQPKVKLMDSNGIDWNSKVKNMPNCRYAIRNGLFNAGERNSALMALAAYEKNQGSNEVTAYYVLKAASKMQAARTGQEEFSKEEIWSNIISVVFADSWKGGQYSCKSEGNWLYDYCAGLGDKKCSHKPDVLVDMPQVYNLFKDYAEQYENNVLFTGIPSLDKKMKFVTGTSNGILAPPGVGKTSFVLQILEHNSNSDVPCLFYSYDMFHSALYMRMLQRQSGMQQDDIYEHFLNNPVEIQDHIKALEANFKNVKFCFKSGQTIDELEDSILAAEAGLGRKPKLVVVDYNELIMTGSEEDPTSSTAIVAQRLRQIANEHEVCIITLLQPSKQFTSPSDEITNYNSIKGSSSTVQSLTLLLGCSRPGFDPLDSSSDKFFNITCLKNRNGPLFTQDLSWEGLTGRIGELEDSDRSYLADIRQSKKDKKTGEPWRNQ